MEDQSIKQDLNKCRPTLCPTEIIKAIAKVRAYGLKKYPEDSWTGVKPQRYIDAMYRHLLSFVEEPTGLDAESHLPHLWHLATNVAFLCELLKDDINAFMTVQPDDISKYLNTKRSD